jgi:hypothetical protein
MIIGDVVLGYRHHRRERMVVMAKGVDPESRQIGLRLKALRIESGLEVEDVADRLDISAPSWYAYERGLQAFPYTRIPGVAKALGVPTGHLIARLFPTREAASFNDRESARSLVTGFPVGAGA